ncbi:Nucleoside-diphosphate-sugar epimerase [Planctomicrobium piriforme]|uniref:Nucleoside-diphosphate-sugar epimerase n=2 Tax=Planctomicrobium piriforme TaxID=1576369 RepID=A0A1I3SBQ8_9PLAN|nr:Nucleoside-diphosphate-sugar epimerase [Planctomicrobium piriforme]
MRALVTGGGGFLGRYIVEQLQARGDQVRIFARGSYPELEQSGVEVHQGDLRDAAAVNSAVQGMDAVFHVAAVPGIWGPWSKYYEINTLGTRHVIAACLAQRVPRLVYTSSPSVVYDGHAHLNADESLPYPASYLCYYPHSKAIAEQEVLTANGQQGLLTVSLRPHLIWGPRDNHLIPRLVQRAQAGRLVRIGDGSNLISMSYVENAAAAHLQAHDALTTTQACAGQAYFINEPEPVRLWDWVNEILVLGNLPPVRRALPATAAWGLGLMCEAVYKTLGRESEPPMTRFLASQLSQSHTYSVARAQRDFGYAPQIDYAEAMRRLRPLVKTLTGDKKESDPDALKRPGR